MNGEIGVNQSVSLLIVGIRWITNENLLYDSRNSVLCGDVNGKKNSQNEDICTRIADSFCCTGKTNTTL